MTIVVNFLGGSGLGKSKVASDVLARLKGLGIESEIALEFAKDLVWEGNLEALKNQIYIFGEQLQRIDRVYGKVDVVVTDSPLLLSTMFKNHHLFQYPYICDTFDKLILQVNNTYNNMNYFIERTIPFNPVGRVEKTVEEAIEKDNKIRKILIDNNILYKSMRNTEEDIQCVMDDIMLRLRN